MNNLNYSRTLGARLCAAGALLTIVSSALAAVHYADVNSTTATPPYTSWATAATNIQDAVDAALAGDEIVVTNGAYPPVAVDKSLTLRSINGSQFTTIDAHGSGRCAYLTNSASLSGFTLSNGHVEDRGGGGGAGALGGTLNNCTLTDNAAFTYRAASYSYGGGAAYCTLNNCTLTGNVAWGAWSGFGGGAAYCTLNNCTLTGNYASGDLFPDINGLGGGAAGCTLNNCIVYFNNAVQGPNCYASTLNYCCTTPDEGGVGNITNAPLFVDPAWPWGNLRLQSTSPCINAGLNALAPAGPDLDGFPRIKGGTVDMGAYEFRVLHYVDMNCTNATPPYTNRVTAATNIQDAVDAADAGDEIVVTNGIYAVGGRATAGDSTTNRVAMDKPITVRSISGPQFTTIDGGHFGRCVYLANGASLSGFTVTNGAAGRGGGVFCESTNALVSNCVLTHNSADFGGGAVGCTLNNCTLSGNSAEDGGGAGSSSLNNCTLSNNSATSAGCCAGGDGGGANNCTLNNCTLNDNVAWGDRPSGTGYSGGGGAFGSTLNNCTLTGNQAIGNFAVYAIGGGAFRCMVNNCTLSGNSAGNGGGASDSTLNNCTVTHNSANGVGGTGFACTLNNCIVYFNTNTASLGANYDNYNSFSTVFNRTCTTPLPTNGFGNITSAPLFVDQTAGNLRLQSNSPCINAGLNAFAPAGPDPDGNPRIAGGTVDIGAYEFQLPTSTISYAWLQQYGLPTDGSADAADPDGDGLNNWQEWRCGTDPTNALSAMRLLAPRPVGSGLVVRWESVADRTYSLERSTTASSGFTTLATGIPGQPGTTAYTDTKAVGAGPWFYRVGVLAP